MEAPNIDLSCCEVTAIYLGYLQKIDDICYPKQCCNCTQFIWERSDATVGDRVAGEAKGLEYTTVLVDNYGSRAAWIGGQTPQVQWPSGKRQGESLDIVKALEPWIHWVVEKRQKQGVYEQKHWERKLTVE